MYSKDFLTSGINQPILAAFKEWLTLQNYEWSTIHYGPKRIAEFMQYCTKEKLQHDHARLFFEHLKKRKHQKQAKGLSTNTLRTYLRTLRLFRRFLREVCGIDLEVHIIFREQSLSHHEVFTQQEIKALYTATAGTLLGMRDRAMLAVYYGCGLRRNEGAQLLTEDILIEQELVFVRKGKNYKQRYVPLIGKSKVDLLEYLRIARPMLIQQKESLALFITNRGADMQPHTLYERLKKLMQKANIKKPCGLHSLRHSIATHLLSNGMALEQIAKLLGHQSLDTTQMYTHIANELKTTSNQKQKP